jgi:hypothetical protein
MLDKKRRFFRLVESYINDYQKDAVELIYGEGSKIKIHNWGNNIKGDTLYFEIIIILGNTINESVMDKSMAEELLKNAMTYFYPEVQRVICMTRFDV